MLSFEAAELFVNASADLLDYGYGWVHFEWPDAIFGKEGLEIDAEGHCSRNMPIHSGTGPPEVLELERNRIKLRFDPALAKRLQLEEEVEIRFSISDEKLCELHNLVKEWRRQR